MRNFLFGVAVAFCALSAPASSAVQPSMPPLDPRHGGSSVDSSPPPSPPVQPADSGDTAEGQVILRYLDALRSHDLAAIRRMLSPGFDFPVRWHACQVRETAADCFLRFLDETVTNVDGRVELQKLRAEWHIVRINIALSNRSTREEGAERVLLTDEFVVENGRIAAFIRTPRTEDPATRAYYSNRWVERQGE